MTKHPSQREAFTDHMGHAPCSFHLEAPRFCEFSLLAPILPTEAGSCNQITTPKLTPTPRSRRVLFSSTSKEIRFRVNHSFISQVYEQSTKIVAILQNARAPFTMKGLKIVTSLQTSFMNEADIHTYDTYVATCLGMKNILHSNNIY